MLVRPRDGRHDAMHTNRRAAESNERDLALELVPRERDGRKHIP